MTLDAIVATFVPSFVLKDPGHAVLVEIHRPSLCWSREQPPSIRPGNSTLVLIANSVAQRAKHSAYCIDTPL